MNTHGKKTEVFCNRDPLWRGVKFWVKRTSDGTRAAFAQPLEFRTLTSEEEGIELPPAFAMQDEQAQQFMDELWRCGFRPTEGTGSAGSLAATERHLADMRALVFKQQPK
jgi:hypothetical protein